MPKWGRSTVNGRAEVVTSSSPLLFQSQVRTRVLASMCLKYRLAKYVLASHRVRSTRARNWETAHIVRHRTAASAKCILGFIGVASTHEPPPMHARWNGEIEHASRTLPGFTTVLAWCVLRIGTVLGQRLMTFHESTSTRARTSTRIEKRPNGQCLQSL